MKAYGGVQPLQYISLRQFGGLNVDTNFDQGNNNLLGANGLEVSEIPHIKTRKPFNKLYTHSCVNNANNITMATYNNKAYIALDKVVKDESNNVIFNLANTNIVSFTKFKGNLGSTHLIFSNGTDLKKYDGTTVSNLLAGGYPVTVNGYFITSFKNRLFCTSNKTTTLLFSALNKADDWATANDAGSIEIDELSDKEITAIYSSNDRLLIFRENAIFELIGTGPSNFRIIQVSNGIGAVNNRSVTSIDGVIYFVHFTGIYAYVSGGNPQKISNPINKYYSLDSFEASGWTTFQNTTFLGTDNVNLYFSTSSIQGSPYTSSYVYNPQTNVWMGFTGTLLCGMTVSSRQTHFCDLYSSYVPNINVYKVVSRKSETPYYSGSNFNWFFWTPLLDTQTTVGNVMIKSLMIRFDSANSFDVYAMDVNKGNTSSAYDAQVGFPSDTTLASYKSSGSLLYSYSYVSGETHQEVRIPIKPLKKNKTISLLFVGTNDFVLREIALEVIPTPFNTNTNI